MPSYTCVDLQNTFYHIYNRGVNKQNIFCDDQDRWSFINLCKKSKLKYKAEFLAFCLMGNHYHLFIHTPEANLSKIMKFINERFSKYYIRKYKDLKKSGHTFMGPYGRRIVQDAVYAKTLLNYIHNNPFKDGFVKHPKDYKWSSYNYYARGVNGFDLINRDILLNKFTPVLSNDQGIAIIDIETLNWNPEKHTLGGIILGDNEFARKLYEKHFQDKDHLANYKRLDTLKFNVSSNEIRSFIQSMQLNAFQYREILIYSLLEWTELQSPELVQEFGLRAASIRKIKHEVKKEINKEQNNYSDFIQIIKEHFQLC